MLRVWGAYFWRGLYMEGHIFGILRYAVSSVSIAWVKWREKHELIINTLPRSVICSKRSLWMFLIMLTTQDCQWPLLHTPPGMTGYWKPHSPQENQTTLTMAKGGRSRRQIERIVERRKLLILTSIKYEQSGRGKNSKAFSIQNTHGLAFWSICGLRLIHPLIF